MKYRTLDECYQLLTKLRKLRVGTLFLEIYSDRSGSIQYNGDNIGSFYNFGECYQKLDKIIRDSEGVTVKLNEEYTAKILDDAVEVGCQLISFEKVEELYKAVKAKRDRA